MFFQYICLPVNNEYSDSVVGWTIVESIVIILFLLTVFSVIASVRKA